jgi:hypothetical protein
MLSKNDQYVAEKLPILSPVWEKYTTQESSFKATQKMLAFFREKLDCCFRKGEISPNLVTLVSISRTLHFQT